MFIGEAQSESEIASAAMVGTQVVFVRMDINRIEKRKEKNHP